jgi:hypothetical protein
MSELTECLDWSDARIALPQRFTQDMADLIVAIVEHVFFTPEIIEDRHPSHIGSRGDLVHSHVVEAALEKEAGRNHRDAMPGSEALTGSAVG